MRAGPQRRGQADPAPDPDARLMMRVRDDEPGAFWELERRWWPTVRNRVAERIGNYHDAEDLAQTVFLKMHRGRAKYTPIATFKTWLRRIIQNTCFNAVRDARTRRHSSRHDLSLSEARQMGIAEEQRCLWQRPADRFLEEVEDIAIRCVRALAYLLDGVRPKKRKRRAQALFRCVPQVMYAAVSPDAPESVSAFTTTIAEMVRRLELPVGAVEIEQLLACAGLVAESCRTGNTRQDLKACGFIPPRPSHWKVFIAAFVVEGAGPMCEMRMALRHQEVTLYLSADAYQLLFWRICQGISEGDNATRTIATHVTQLVVEQVQAKLGSRSNCVLRMGALGDTGLLSLDFE